MYSEMGDPEDIFWVYGKYTDKLLYFKDLDSMSFKKLKHYATALRLEERWMSEGMQIEEGFRDTKNSEFGLGIAKQARIQPDRLRNMLLICALASLALWLIGKAVVSHPIARHVQVNTSTQRDVYSTIFLARLIIGHTDFRIRDSDVVKAREAILEYYISLDLVP